MDRHRFNLVGRLCQTPGVSQRRPTIADFLISIRPKKRIAAAQTRWRVIPTMSADAADQSLGLRKIGLVLLALGAVSMICLIVAGATSLISLADRIHPVAGTFVFWGLCLAAGFLALYCVIAYAQLPPALVPPKETSGPEYRGLFADVALAAGE